MVDRTIGIPTLVTMFDVVIKKIKNCTLKFGKSWVMNWDIFYRNCPTQNNHFSSNTCYMWSWCHTYLLGKHIYIYLNPFRLPFGDNSFTYIFVDGCHKTLVHIFEIQFNTSTCHQLFYSWTPSIKGLHEGSKLFLFIYLLYKLFIHTCIFFLANMDLTSHKETWM